MAFMGLYKSSTVSLFVHFGSFYVFLALVYTLPFFASFPPSDDREKTDSQPRQDREMK